MVKKNQRFFWSRVTSHEPQVKQNKKSKIKISKRAQMKIQQMTFMLIAITILFALVALFALGGTFGGVEEKAMDLKEAGALKLVSAIASSPELSCGSAFGKDRVNCVDFDKAIALKRNINEYKDFWEVDEIMILKVYEENLKECTLSDYSDCGILKILDGDNKGVGYFSYVSLCKKVKGEFGVYDKCEIAKLIVRVKE